MSSATTSGPETMRLARDERADLAEFLATLTPEQWEAPTLCTLWRVRDVVAHIYSYEDLGLIGFLPRFAAAAYDSRPGLRPSAPPNACAGSPSRRPIWPGPPARASRSRAQVRHS